MKKRLSKLSIMSIIVGACLFLSIIGSFLTQTSFFSVKQTVVTTTLTKLVQTINDNNEKNGKDYGKTLTVGTSSQISLAVYKPSNASSTNKVPVIICAHGNTNVKEMQFMNYIELSKRGFAVVTVDTAGHGRTDASVINEGNWNPAAGVLPFSPFGDPKETVGTLAATEYAMSLDFVDENKVGVTGHSGGNLALAGVVLEFEDYRSQYQADPDNVAKFTKKISAFYCPSGTAAAPALNGIKDLDGFLLATASGRYDELDTLIFGTHQMEKAAVARSTFNHFTGKTAADSFIPADQDIPLGQYWNSNGRIADPEPGQKLASNSGVVIYNPNYTHPGSMFSYTGANLMVNFFYSAYGVPSGATFLSGTVQSWQVAMAFQILGLVSFFASAFVIGAWLLKRKIFASITLKQNSPECSVKTQDKLPSIKKWQEIVPLVVTFVPLVLLSIFTYKYCINNGASRLRIDSYFAAPVSVAWYTLVSGLIAFILIGFNYVVKKLCYIGKSSEITPNIMATAKVSSFSQFFKIVLFAIEVVVLMYIPQIIAYFGFDVVFSAAVYGVGVPRLIWLPQMLTIFLPMFLLFAVANGALNASTRFKEMPEWASTLLCVVANVLPIIILVAVNYGYISINGHPMADYLGNPAIFTWNFLAPMIFIGLTGRYFYKKTGNIWAAAFINALVLTLMATTLTKHMSDIPFILISL